MISQFTRHRFYSTASLEEANLVLTKKFGEADRVGVEVESRWPSDLGQCHAVSDGGSGSPFVMAGQAQIHTRGWLGQRIDWSGERVDGPPAVGSAVDHPTHDAVQLGVLQRLVR
jgi:hypothetical protein